MKSCLIIVVIIDHLELGLEPEPAHVVIKTPKWTTERILMMNED